MTRATCDFNPDDELYRCYRWRNSPFPGPIAEDLRLDEVPEQAALDVSVRRQPFCRDAEAALDLHHKDGRRGAMARNGVAMITARQLPIRFDQSGRCFRWDKADTPRCGEPEHASIRLTQEPPAESASLDLDEVEMQKAKVELAAQMVVAIPATRVQS